MYIYIYTYVCIYIYIYIYITCTQRRAARLAPVDHLAEPPAAAEVAVA